MSILNSKLLKVGLGALSGGATLGPALGIGTTAGAIAGGVGAASNSPLGRAIGMTGTALSINNMLKGGPGDMRSAKQIGADIGGAAGTTPAEIAGGGTGGFLGGAAGRGGDAIGRAVSNNPLTHISTGLKLASDKSLGLPEDLRMSTIETLLRAKHFGYPGGKA